MILKKNRNKRTQKFLTENWIQLLFMNACHQSSWLVRWNVSCFILDTSENVRYFGFRVVDVWRSLVAARVLHVDLRDIRLPRETLLIQRVFIGTKSHEIHPVPGICQPSARGTLGNSPAAWWCQSAALMFSEAVTKCSQLQYCIAYLMFMWSCRHQLGKWSAQEHVADSSKKNCCRWHDVF
jgi:hypothetical protein